MARVLQQTVLSGVRKAAIVTLMLGEEATAEMFRYLSETEIERLAKEMAALGAIAPTQSQEVLEEFHQLLVAAARPRARRRDGAARHGSHRPLAAVDGGVHLAREGGSGAALQVHPRRASADHRPHPGAPEFDGGRRADHAAARRPAGRRADA